MHDLAFMRRGAQGFRQVKAKTICKTPHPTGKRKAGRGGRRGTEGKGRGEAGEVERCGGCGPPRPALLAGSLLAARCSLVGANSARRAGAGSGLVRAPAGRGAVAWPCSAPGVREMASPLSPAAPAIVSPGVA